MNKEKKTAFDCVLWDISSGDNDWCLSICPVRNKCSSILCREECIEKLKSHYKQQATILDGWEAVKQILHELDKRSQIQYENNHKADCILYASCARYVWDLLKNNGFEPEKLFIDKLKEE